MSLQAEERAIEMALSRRHWAIVQRWPGRYVAQLDARVHEVTIAVNYSQQGIQIDYVSSTNLMYGRTYDGREVIHRKYSVWVRDLAVAIQNELARIPPEPSLTVWSRRGLGSNLAGNTGGTAVVQIDVNADVGTIAPVRVDGGFVVGAS
jgi:hypothetical protein